MRKGLPVVGQAEGRRERADAAENRARILAAARKLVKKRPLDELCMHELAAAAGVGKGTLYRRFADKQALLHALLDDDERQLQNAVHADFASARTDPAGAVVALLARLFDFVVTHAAVLAAAEASARGTPRLEAPPYAWRHAVVRHHLERAAVAKGPAADQVADMLLASMSGDVVARALTQRSADDVRAEARAFFETIATLGPR